MRAPAREEEDEVGVRVDMVSWDMPVYVRGTTFEVPTDVGAWLMVGPCSKILKYVSLETTN